MKNRSFKTQNIALISPALNSYSETFIQEHKNLNSGNVKYYYGGALPRFLEGHGTLLDKALLKRLISKISASIFGLSLLEYKLYLSLKKQKVKLVFAEYGITGAKLLNICKLNNIPLIVHFHGYDAHRNDILDEYHHLYKEMFKYVSAIFVVSKIMKEKLLSLGLEESKLIMNTYGPRQDFYLNMPQYSKLKLVSIGRFVDKKAHYYVLLVFKKVLEKYPEAQLVFGGEGFLLNCCKNLAKALKIDNNVHFKGVMTKEQIINEYKDAQLYIQHSIVAEDGDMEGTPLSILEASAAGIPVISTFHAGIPEVVQHNKSGMLVAEHDIDTMTNYVLDLLGNKELLKKMGTFGRDFISENYSIEKHINKINEIIKLHT